MSSVPDEQIIELAKTIYAQNVDAENVHRQIAAEVAIGSLELSKIFYDMVDGRYGAE